MRDLLCVGEILIDFLGQEKSSLVQTSTFNRHLGGSPTNVAVNTSHLGLEVTLVGTLGQDGLGDFALEQLKQTQVDTSFVPQKKGLSTSSIIVSRTEETPEFVPLREADKYISSDQFSDSLLKNSKVFHTTCFALSASPAQETILAQAQRAFDWGCRLSIDLNYAPKIWKNSTPVLEVIKSYIQWNPLVKISEVDVQRIFNQPMEHSAVFDFFHTHGAETVCLTLGKEGVKLSHKSNAPIFLPAPILDHVVDVTGAGDAFWSGFLYGYLKDYSWEKCLELALQIAEIKLQRVGHLPANVNTLLH